MKNFILSLLGYKGLVEDYELLKKAVKVLKESMESFDDFNEKLKQENKELKNVYNYTYEELVECKGALRQNIKDLEVTKGNYKCLDITVHELNTKVKELEDENYKLKNALDAIKDTANEVDTLASTMQSYLSELTDSVDYIIEYDYLNTEDDDVDFKDNEN